MAELREDTNMVAGVKTLQGYVAKEQGAYERAQTRLEEARRLATLGRSEYVVRMASQLLTELFVDSGNWELMAEELAKAKPRAHKHADWLGSEQVEMMSRCLAVQERRYGQAVCGLSSSVAQYVERAKELPSPEYRWAGLGLELLAQCLSAGGETPIAARVFGSSQAMTERDAAGVSPNIRARWDRLFHAANLSGRESEILEGRAMTSAEALTQALSSESLVPCSASPLV